MVALCAAGFACERYKAFVADAARQLEAGSDVALTTAGPVEYAALGASPRTLLFIHGTPGGYDQGAAFAEFALSRGFRTVAPSRPGYLGTPQEVGTTPAEQAESFAALLDALEISRVAVVAASGGGPSALEFAARHPLRCWSVVTVGAVTGPRDPEGGPSSGSIGSGQGRAWRAFARSDFYGWLTLRLAKWSPARALGRVVPDAATRHRILSDPDKLARFHRHLASVAALPERRSAGASNDRAQFEHLPPFDFGSLEPPVLAIHGRRDERVPFEMSEALVLGAPDAELDVVPDGGHLVLVSHEDEVFARIFEFLDEQWDRLQRRRGGSGPGREPPELANARSGDRPRGSS